MEFKYIRTKTSPTCNPNICVYDLKEKTHIICVMISSVALDDDIASWCNIGTVPDCHIFDTNDFYEKLTMIIL